MRTLRKPERRVRSASRVAPNVSAANEIDPLGPEHALSRDFQGGLVARLTQGEDLKLLCGKSDRLRDSKVCMMLLEPVKGAVSDDHWYPS